MSVTMVFENDCLAKMIQGFEDSRRIYATSSSKHKKESKFPKKVSLFINEY